MCVSFGNCRWRPPFSCPGRAAGEHDRQRAEVVLVAVAQRAAVEHQRVIQQRAVAVRRLLQLLDEVGELRHVVGVQQREAIHVAAVVRVVRQVVERIADAGLREDGAAQLAREHQRRDARDVRLERDHLQVHQQLEVLLERRRHAGRHVRQRDVLARRRLGALNPPLDLAHVVEILVQPPAIARRQILLQRRTCPITESSRLRDSCRRARRSASVAPSPNSFSNTSRGLFCIGSGWVGRLPRDRVAVGAAERRLAREHRLLDRQLQRRQRRVLADVLRGDLVGRDAEVRLRPALRHRRRSGTPPPRACGSRPPRRRRRRRPRRTGCARPLTMLMRSRNGSSGFRISVNAKPVPSVGRRPLVHRRAVRHVERHEPRLRRGGALPQRRLRADHRVEQRQRHGGADAPQERAPRQMFLRDEHRHCSGCCWSRLLVFASGTARSSRRRARTTRSGSRSAPRRARSRAPPACPAAACARPAA